MLHVVNWFFNTVRPDLAIFGAKDAQQLFLIRRMVKREFESKITIVEAPTVRESDGLARSSRNRYLNAEARAVAPKIYEALGNLATDLASGAEPATALEEGRLALSAIPLAKLDYLALVDKSTFQPIAPGFSGEAQLIVAVVLDGVRLIDNLNLTIQGAA
ncbi:MAG: 4-phosphopantoate--beta-alanine ligase [Microbacteriaceae bacterium]|nr:4-phosphopantoate--beta-alanine ligase [Microbacteriaceae bacterium]